MRYEIVTEAKQLDSLDFLPTSALVFYAFDAQDGVWEMYREIKKRFPELEAFGCSGTESYHALRTKLRIDTQSTVWVLMALRDEAASVHLYDCSGDSLPVLDFEPMKEVSAILLCAMPFDSVSPMVQHVKESVGEKNVYGAVSGSERLSNADTSLFHNGVFLHNHMLIWAFDKTYYSLKGRSVHDFEPIGIELTVTKARENRICEIENKPALAMLESITGPISDESVYAFEHPLALHAPYSAQGCTEQNVLASLYSVDRESNSITLFSRAVEGSKVKVSIPIQKTAMEKRRREFASAIRQKRSGIALVFSCIGIKRFWNTLAPIYYLIHIGELLDMDVVGFYSFGEIGSLSDACGAQLQNQTYTGVTIVEKEDVR